MASCTKILITFGTRPEAIKMAPLVLELKKRPDHFEVEVCVTAQHRQMLDQALEIFAITPDYDMDVMQDGQTLPELTGRLIAGFDKVLEKSCPDIVIVQGDTTTTFCCALAAFYRQIKVAHIEAGLRTDNRYSPFPEEINRRMTANLTDWHFPPTERSRQALLRERYPEDSVFKVGNTVIDALLMVAEKVRGRSSSFEDKFSFLANDARIVLITGHRRESFGAGFEDICSAIKGLAQDNPAVRFVYAVHLNPNVHEPVNRLLKGLDNIHLIPPQDYLNFVWLMDRAHIILTDSGGVQEEAPSLGKPVIVMRDVTERMEAVEAGTALLVGADKRKIIGAVQGLLNDEKAYHKMAQTKNPFGDGMASQRIADILQEMENT